MSDMTHALPNCPKLKLPVVMVVQVCTVNGQTGLYAVRNARAESLVDSNITTVALNQSLKSELVALTDGLTGHFGQNAVRPVLEPDPDNKLISVALTQSLKRKNAEVAVHSLAGHHGVFAVKNVPVVFHLDHVFTNVVWFLKNNPKHAVVPDTTVSGLPGVSAMMVMAILSFVEVVFVDELEMDSVEISTKFKMLNVTHNDAVTIAPGLPGLVVQPHVAAVFKNEPLMIVMVWLFKSIDKSVPTLL